MSFQYPSSSKIKDQLVDEFLQNPERFDELMALYLNNEVDDMYGWPITHTIQKRPSLAKGWTKGMIGKLRASNRDDTKRNLSRSFQYMDIPEADVPPLLDIAYEILNKATEKTAARVFCMTIIYNQVKVYPELGRELLDTLTELYPMGSTGFQNRAKKIISALSKKIG